MWPRKLSSLLGSVIAPGLSESSRPRPRRPADPCLPARDVRRRPADAAVAPALAPPLFPAGLGLRLVSPRTAQQTARPPLAARRPGPRRLAAHSCARRGVPDLRRSSGRCGTSSPIPSGSTGSPTPTGFPCSRCHWPAISATCRSPRAPVSLYHLVAGFLWPAGKPSLPAAHGEPKRSPPDKGFVREGFHTAYPCVSGVRGQLPVGPLELHRVAGRFSKRKMSSRPSRRPSALRTTVLSS